MMNLSYHLVELGTTFRVCYRLHKPKCLTLKRICAKMYNKWSPEDGGLWIILHRNTGYPGICSLFSGGLPLTNNRSVLSQFFREEVVIFAIKSIQMVWAYHQKLPPGE